jgi:hypothetical protein
MPEFKSLQEQISKARINKEAGKLAVINIQEKLKKIQRKKQQLSRSKSKDSDAFQRLVKDENNLKTELRDKESRFAESLKVEDQIINSFSQFTDPRQNSERLSDDFPVLLFPVRMETRFKKITSLIGAVSHQLWVRIFPDDCSIDTFENTLSDSEITKARNYWINLWKAGKPVDENLEQYVQNKQKGAWRELMGTLNAGRAYWITLNYLPDNIDEIPERNKESDVLLIIPTEELPAQNIQDALQDYWENIFLAGGNAQESDSIFSDFVAAIGGNEEEAHQLIIKYKPNNIEDENPDSENPPDVSVVFLIFPGANTVDSRQSQWSRASRVTMFPDRFVLLGYQKNNPVPVVNELGNLIPNPLIIGPDPGEDLNSVLKTIFGDEFENLPDEEKASKYVEYLSKESETKWLFDFDEAIRIGLGFKVDLSQNLYEQGFEKLFALGIKVSSNEAKGKTSLEQLIQHHHYGESGFSLIPQGTPTNNTEDSGSGYSVNEDTDEAFARYISGSEEEDSGEWEIKRDGRWLAELLGIDVDSSTLELAENYYCKDQSEARAMNTAIWNSTLGYFTESMLTPVFNDTQRNIIRWFLTNHVSGRGRVPAIRIGHQPYGILPVTALSNLNWLRQAEKRFPEYLPGYLPVLDEIYNVLTTIKNDWELLLDNVAHVGKTGDIHKILLEALGLHPTSTEFDQRYAESFQHLFNELKLKGVLGSIIAAMIAYNYKKEGMDLLKKLGYVPDETLNPEIPILEKFFLTQENDVNKPLIDDRSLSETDPIREYTNDGSNYIKWLIDNAENNHQNIKDQTGFKDNNVPEALLYDMLRHALNLEFSNTGLKLFQNAEILDTVQVRNARIDSDFIGIQAQNNNLESKWDIIYREEPLIAEKGTLIVDHISNLLKTSVVNTQTKNLYEVISALKLLEDTPTARLERSFVEHLDLCTYRLDAWLEGFVNLQLSLMRFNENQEVEETKKGIYLGAYGWVENLKPDNKILTQKELDTDLKKIFDPDDQGNIVTDNTNAGYIHAPSINQALTAAVLRNAYISTAAPDEAEIYKVNLSSERVRMALQLIEGMQQGQSLGALLGYQLERGLHDRTDLELDSYIYELRKVFSLVSNRMTSTEIKLGKTAPTVKISKRFQEEINEFEDDNAVNKIEARNVVDGLALLNHIKDNEEKAQTDLEKQNAQKYPFGFPIGTGPDKLKDANNDIKNAINAEVQRLMNIRDAISDLALAESVHQVVQGNYDRASGALDTYSKGNYPQTPDVIQTPNSGINLTHRFGIHIPSGLNPADGTTPRSIADRGVNEFLLDLFPDDLSDIACKVEYRIPNYESDVPNAAQEKIVNMSELGLEPIDLLYMLDTESEKNLTSLDDYILKFVFEDDTIRPDVELEIKYTDKIEDKITLFELASLIRSLRSLLVTSRPLVPTDIMLQNEGSKEKNTDSFINPERISKTPLPTPPAAPKEIMDDIHDHLESDFITPISSLIVSDNLEDNFANLQDIIDNIDTLLNHFVNLLHQLCLFGLPQTGFGFVYDRKKLFYASLYKKVLDFKIRWDDKLIKYNDIINNQVPAAGTDEEKISLMQKAERLISAENTFPITSVSDFQNKLDIKKQDFEDKLDELVNFLSDNFTTIKSLMNAIEGIKSDLDTFDLIKLDTTDDEKQVVVFTEDLKTQAEKLAQMVSDKSIAVQTLLDEYNSTSISTEKVQKLTKAAKILFGEDFQVVPEFNLNMEQADELQNCLNNQNKLLDYQKNTLLNDFPIDEWLYGIARVREKLGAWENVAILAEGLKERPSLDLTPMQLPHDPEDRWLGLSYPEGFNLEGDKLLYTAYIPGFDPGKTQCGLLVDEWTEVIPAKKETTGISFHYDRPNTEPPQSLLLVTPSSFTGSWKWDDLVNSLHETLKLAKLRAIEPDQIDQTNYAEFIPATVAAVTSSPVTMMLNYAVKFDANLNINSE